jgi:hypothetical protein
MTTLICPIPLINVFSHLSLLFVFLTIFFYNQNTGSAKLNLKGLMLMKLIYFFIFLFVFKLTSNIYFFMRTNSLQTKYKSWIKNLDPNFYTYKSEIIELLKRASVKDLGIASAEPLGFGYISTHSASVFLNFPNLHKSHVSAALRMFDEAIGTYRLRIKECFSPLYWIEQILFLPKNVLLYLNLDPNKTSFKISNLLLSFIWWLFLLFLNAFRDRLKEAIIYVIDNVI